MALDWITREQERPGIIAHELNRAEGELELFRLAGKELRYPKEKRDILQLALSQIRPPPPPSHPPPPLPLPPHGPHSPLGRGEYESIA